MVIFKDTLFAYSVTQKFDNNTVVGKLENLSLEYFLCSRVPLPFIQLQSCVSSVSK